MDTLHTVLRTIRGEAKSAPPDHITVFREFLNQLERINRRGAKSPRTVKRTRAKSARSAKR
jgi:hypothetical protein